MKINISTHAAKRALERGISEEGIRAIVNGDVFRVTLESKSDLTAIIFVGMYAGKHWSVVFNFLTNNVITARRSQKDEIRYYETKIRRIN